MRIVVTGGSGFIGSTLVRRILSDTEHHVCSIDKQSYAATWRADQLTPVQRERCEFHVLDILNEQGVLQLLEAWRPDAVIHLAAETHVDRSIDSPMSFITNNALGTAALLESVRVYWRKQSVQRREAFRWLQVSTDEVYGALGVDGQFNEESRYQPNSPYAASKAAADHFVRAWARTFGIPAITSHSCNNYGPQQFPEKLIPLMIWKAIEGQPMPIYGDGSQIRDWIHVEDHVAALIKIVETGTPGQAYDVAGSQERTNRSVVEDICGVLDRLRPKSSSHRNQISYVADRPGHDFRYSIEGAKLRNELDWSPQVDWNLGLEKTVAWYLENQSFFEEVKSRGYSGQRLGKELS